MGQCKPEWFAPTELHPRNVGLLQGILAFCLHGWERDLLRAERLPNPAATCRETAAGTRLLEGLEQGFIAGPDDDARKLLGRLMADADEANGYSIAIAEHDAFDGLLKQLEGKRLDESHGSSRATGLVGSPTVETQLKGRGQGVCPGRRPNEPLQRATLALVLQEHPAELTMLELADRLFDRIDHPEASTPLAYAVRDLAVGGLLKSMGPLVLPTRAALQVKQLKLSR